MSTHDQESVGSRYLSEAGPAVDGWLQLAVDELRWLVEHSTQLGERRLELLQALQAALPRAEDGGSLAELKELLTDVIIMQTRLADRNRRLNKQLNQVVDAGLPDRVPVDEAAVRDAIEAVLRAAAHVQAVAGEGTPP